ncbi:ClbS/DfsB family four-helix bundle protein [Microbacterium sp. TNHR37B]|uniref:ClbS/DfsB family four-helix bundle protein n=1 Tax=Microbacterium sp. TNHR37B TaxID=1775956 RepID=UPI000A7FF544
MKRRAVPRARPRSLRADPRQTWPFHRHANNSSPRSRRPFESRSDEELYGAPWYRTWTMGRMISFNTSSPYANARGRLRAWLRERAR